MKKTELTPLTRWTFPISLFSPLSAFLLGSDTVYRWQCPFEWQREKKKRLLNVGRKGFFFFFVPAIGFLRGQKKTSPLFSTGKQIKKKQTNIFLRFFKRGGDIQCVKVLLRCFVYYLFVCLRTPLGGEDQSTRIKKRPSWMVDAVCCHMVAEGMTRFSRAFEFDSNYFKIERRGARKS